MHGRPAARRGGTAAGGAAALPYTRPQALSHLYKISTVESVNVPSFKSVPA
jgi:hypothetical protein